MHWAVPLRTPQTSSDAAQSVACAQMLQPPMVTQVSSFAPVASHAVELGVLQPPPSVGEADTSGQMHAPVWPVCPQTLGVVQVVVAPVVKQPLLSTSHSACTVALWQKEPLAVVQYWCAVHVHTADGAAPVQVWLAAHAVPVAGYAGHPPGASNPHVTSVPLDAHMSSVPGWHIAGRPHTHAEPPAGQVCWALGQALSAVM